MSHRRRTNRSVRRHAGWTLLWATCAGAASAILRGWSVSPTEMSRACSRRWPGRSPAGRTNPGHSAAASDAVLVCGRPNGEKRCPRRMAVRLPARWRPAVTCHPARARSRRESSAPRPDRAGDFARRFGRAVAAVGPREPGSRDGGRTKPCAGPTREPAATALPGVTLSRQGGRISHRAPDVGHLLKRPPGPRRRASPGRAPLRPRRTRGASAATSLAVPGLRCRRPRER